MAKCKCSISDIIKSGYPLIIGVNEKHRVPFFTKCPGFEEEKMEMSIFLKKKIIWSLDKSKQIITWAKRVHAENVSHKFISSLSV
jgi:hypothetical protein